VEEPGHTRGLAKRDVALLRDVLEFPISGVVERYRRLRLNRRKGNAAKEECLERNLIRQVPIPTRSGRVVLLELTQQGLEALASRGIADGCPKLPPHRGSLEHEYWRSRAAAFYEGEGYMVSMEEPVNGHADMVVRHDGASIAVEIETGKSQWRDNIARDLSAGFDEVVVVCTNDAAYGSIAPEALERWSDEASRLRVIRAQDLCG
jgi:hypothetical protein